jgi:type I restriction enzyme S subunit
MFEAELRSPNKTPLGEIVEEFRYGTSNKASQSEGYPTLRIPNVVGGNIDATDLKSVPLSDAYFNRLKLVDGDVLFVRTNGNPDYVGRSAVFTLAKANAFGTEKAEWAYASYLIRARPKTKILNPWFLQAYLSHPLGKKALKERSKTSAGQFNINTDGLGSIPIPIAPIERQIEFETVVAGLAPMTLSLFAAEQHSGSLFESLQHRAFRGEL